MSIFIKGGRAAKFLKKAKRGLNKAKLPAAVIGASTVVGGLSYYESAQPGLKHPASKEGALTGALTGTALVLSPKLGRAVGRRSVRQAKVIKRKGQLVFRKIRGRIIPIRRKK